MSEKEAKEEVAKRYPSGCITRTLLDIYKDEDTIVSKFWHITTGGQIWMFGTPVNPIVYQNGVWAEVLGAPEITFPIFN